MKGPSKSFLTERRWESEGIQWNTDGGEMYADDSFNPHLLHFLRTYFVYIYDLSYFLMSLESLS